MSKNKLSFAITGTSRGLGFELSKELLKRGHIVYGLVHEVNEQDKSSINHPNYKEFIGSVKEYSDLIEFSEFATAESSVDIVIANAGVINKRVPSWIVTKKDWDNTINTNVLGVIYTLKAFMPKILKNEKALFIATSSGWGRNPSSGLAPYCASKFAVEGIIGALNYELPKNVRGIALDPGNGVNTSMLKQCLPDDHSQYISPSEWAVYAADYIINQIYLSNKSGSLTVDHAGL